MANFKIILGLIAYFLSSYLVYGQDTFAETSTPDYGTCFSTSAHNALRNKVNKELIKRYCPTLYDQITNPNRPVLNTEIYGKTTENLWDDIVGSCELGIVGISSMMICRSSFRSFITSIQVSYHLANRSVYKAPKHGGSGGICSSIQLADDEFFTNVQVGTNGSLINYLFLTSHITSTGYDRTHGPYGATSQTPHQVSGYILGFRGYSLSSVDGLGVFFLPALTKESTTYGGTCSDQVFDDMVDNVIPPVIAIKRINIFHVDLIHAIQTTYVCLDGSLYEGQFVGNVSSEDFVENVTISLTSDHEVIYQVNATSDSKYPTFLAGLTFYTRLMSTSTIYGQFGEGNDVPIAIPGTILGFHGYYGFNRGLGFDNICQIGIYRVDNPNFIY